MLSSLYQRFLQRSRPSPGGIQVPLPRHDNPVRHSGLAQRVDGGLEACDFDLNQDLQRVVHVTPFLLEKPDLKPKPGRDLNGPGCPAKFAPSGFLPEGRTNGRTNGLEPGLDILQTVSQGAMTFTNRGWTRDVIC